MADLLLRLSKHTNLPWRTCISKVETMTLSAVSRRVHSSVTQAAIGCHDGPRRPQRSWRQPQRSCTTKAGQLFLHVAPDGDHWSGPTIFAAKHLSTDFIVSVPIQVDFELEKLTDADLTEIYDTKRLPERLLDSPAPRS